MRIAYELIQKPIVACLVLSMAATSGKAVAQEPQSPASIQQAQAAPSPHSQPPNSDDPGANHALQNVPAQSSGSSGQSSTSQSAPDRQDSAAKPVGTAAAPAGKANGAAASSPAGAVIAPAKQRRVRSIFIKVGVIAAAVVAVGTVAALSHASPSTAH
jgi:hypothetical protein